MDQELYNLDGIRINVNERDTDCHDVRVGRNYFLLQRGILNEMARSDLPKTRQMLSTLSNGLVDHYLEDAQIPFENLALALAQARIRELEDEIAYHLSEGRKK